MRGQRVLRVTSRALELDLEISRKAVMPKRQKDLWEAGDFWRLSGIIESELRFECDRVSPGSRTDHWQIGRVKTTQTLRLPTIELISAGWDKLTEAGLRRKLHRPRQKPRRFPSVRFLAVFVGCESPFINAGTTTTVHNDFFGKLPSFAADTFIDRAKDYDFALIRKGADLELHFQSKAGFRSKNEKDDRRRFDAVLAAIGFTHGFQPWPFRIIHWRDGRKVSDSVTAASKLDQTSHRPFDETLGMIIPAPRRKGSRNSPIKVAAQFFEQQSDDVEELRHFLFLFRAASNRVDPRLRILALCSIFEGVVGLLFSQRALGEKLHRRQPHFDEFVRARDRLRNRLERFASPKNKALARLAGTLGKSEPFRVKDKFEALCDEYLLPSKSMKRYFKSWYAKRNPAMHGRLDSKLKDFVHECRIAGGINILVLKAMGYSGRVRAVTFALDRSEVYTTI